jgi:hypothetical protein
MGRVSIVEHVQVGRSDGKSMYSGACTGGQVGWAG